MNNIKSRGGVEAELWSLQRENKIPRYLCYWADGAVTQGDERSPVLEAARRRTVYDGTGERFAHNNLKAGLLAYLTPHGQFFTTEGVWVVPGGLCPCCGNWGISYDEYDPQGRGWCPYGCGGDMTEMERRFLVLQ